MVGSCGWRAQSGQHSKLQGHPLMPGYHSEFVHVGGAQMTSHSAPHHFPGSPVSSQEREGPSMGTAEH